MQIHQHHCSSTNHDTHINESLSQWSQTDERENKNLVQKLWPGLQSSRDSVSRQGQNNA